MLAALTHSDLSTILVVIGIGCVLGAAYMAYLRNALGVGLFLVVAVIAFLAAD